MRASPTLEDVAREAGVSAATASRVLNGSSRVVADSFRTRVEAAANTLGYSPNLSARATARGTSDSVILFVADIADPYFAQIAAGVTRRAAEAGLFVSIAVTGRDDERELAQIRAARGQRPRAIILSTSRAGQGITADLHREVVAAEAGGTTVVAFGAGAGSIPSIHIDNEEGARALARALSSRGYTRAFVLAAAEGTRTSDSRSRGFARGFERAGGEILRIYRGDFTREFGARAASDLVRTRALDTQTVVFSVSDVIALGALAGFRGAGRRIGDDVAVAGFDDIPNARDVTPNLTTVRVPLEKVGYRALDVALGAEAPHVAQVEVVLRESTPDRR